MQLGELTNEAADINVVRTRANASAVAAANVSIDYILDERMRELGDRAEQRCQIKAKYWLLTHPYNNINGIS